MDEIIKTTINKWLIKADNDLKTAEFCLTAEQPITDTICFHCQQAVEKYLKLFIVSKMSGGILANLQVEQGNVKSAQKVVRVDCFTVMGVVEVKVME
jgi:hypothetical protein